MEHKQNAHVLDQHNVEQSLVIFRSKIRNSWWHLIREHLFTALQGLFLFFMLIDLFHVSTSSIYHCRTESLVGRRDETGLVVAEGSSGK